MLESAEDYSRQIKSRSHDVSNIAVYESQTLIFSEDLRKAVESVNKLGSDFKIIKMGEKRVICSVSVELNDDHLQLLKVAEEGGGFLTHTTVSAKVPSYKDKSRF